ncbi:MAG: hypothetical protein H6741_23350 [Alphaproteobacteria bacterium]|nr:hypothetical protein [Alphaproteobacteria bacterium]MCB9795645.1 hypothetical protein [Alphaproteobacteria bacterium]
MPMRHDHLPADTLNLARAAAAAGRFLFFKLYEHDLERYEARDLDPEYADPWPFDERYRATLRGLGVSALIEFYLGRCWPGFLAELGDEVEVWPRIARELRSDWDRNTWLALLRRVWLGQVPCGYSAGFMARPIDCSQRRWSGVWFTLRTSSGLAPRVLADLKPHLLTHLNAVVGEVRLGIDLSLEQPIEGLAELGRVELPAPRVALLCQRLREMTVRDGLLVTPALVKRLADRVVAARTASLMLVPDVLPGAYRGQDSSRSSATSCTLGSSTTGTGTTPIPSEKARIESSAGTHRKDAR